jgi:FtsZ-interacting cell division protein YlmF
MKEKIRGLMTFLGLVEDEYREFDRADETRPFTEAEEAPVRPAPPTRRPVAANERPRPTTRPLPETPRPVTTLTPSEAPRPKVAMTPSRTVSPFTPERDIQTVVVTQFEEIQRVTDILRENRAVVLLLATADDTTRRRCIDFTVGTVYALQAKMHKLSQRGNFFVVPAGLPLGAGVVERLRQQH